MAKFLFTWELGAGWGHLVDMRPLAGRLVSRGHRVTLALRDLARARAVFQDLDVDLLPAPHKTQCASAGNDICTFAQLLASIGFSNFEQLNALAGAWRNLISLVRPEVIVCDHSPTALLASLSTQAARVSVGAGFFCPLDEFPLPNLRSWIDVDPEKLLDDELHVLTTMNRVLGRLGGPQLERVSQLYHPLDEIFLRTFGELDHYPARRDARYWGTWTIAQGSTPEWPAGGGPRIFAYLKQFPALDQLLSGLGQLDCPVLVYGDGLDQSWKQRFSTPGLRFVPEPLAIDIVSRECQAAVLNGNHATTIAMLREGKPTLQIPITLEQALFTQRVASLGAAVAASPTGHDSFDERLRMVLDDRRFTTGAEKFAARYADYDAAEAIERMVDRFEALATQH